MSRMECDRESDVLLMVGTGRWPDRAPADLCAHAADCTVCSELALVSSAIGAEREHAGIPQLPASGVVWWRAQLRARQEAARQAVRPITATQAVAFAALVGTVGAVFGASAQWFQDSLRWFGRGFAGLLGSVRLPGLPSLPVDLTSVWVGYWVMLLAAGLSVVAGALIIGWAMRED